MEKNACCIKNGKSMCDAFFFVSRFNMMNKDFLKWFHHIPILQFFNTSSHLFGRCHFCCALLIYFYRQQKPHLSVAVRMWTMRSMNGIVIEFKKKKTYKLYCVRIWWMCACLVVFRLLMRSHFMQHFCHFSSMRILHFAFESKEHSLHSKMQCNLNCAFLATYHPHFSSLNYCNFIIFM